MMSIVPVDVKVPDFISPYTTFSKPIPYKELFIYPVKMSEEAIFKSASNILLIDKNKSADAKIIQMNYLQFLYGLIVQDDTWKEKFITLMRLCFHVDKVDKIFIEQVDGALLYKKVEDGAIIYFNGLNIKFYVTKTGLVTLEINDVKISANEFNEISKIILYQNINGYDDEEMSEDFRKVVENYYKLKNKNIIPPSTEDKIDAVMAQTGLLEEDIEQMTCRRFDRIFEKIIGKEDYKIGKLAEIHGATKETTEHWIYKSNKNKYAHIFTDADAFQKEITNT